MSKHLITFGTIQWHILFPISYGVISLINSLFIEQIYNANFQYQLFVMLYIPYIGKIMWGFLDIISLILQKRRKKRSSTIQEKKELLPEINQSDSNESFISNGDDFYQLPDKSYKLFKLLLLIIVCSIFNYSYLFFKTIFIELKQFTIENADDKYNAGIVICQIIVLCILSRIYLKYVLYKHLILGLAFIMFGNIIFFIDTFPSWKHYDFYLVLLGTSMNSVQIVIEKHIMEHRFITPLRLLFIEGVFGLIINSLMFYLFYLFRDSDMIYCFSIKIQDVRNITTKIKEIIILLLIFTFTRSISSLAKMMSNAMYNPNYIYIGNIIYMIINTMLFIVSIFSQIFDIYTLLDWIRMLEYLFLLIGCMIYNEIIILNFCGLERNTKIVIQNRAIESEIGYIDLSK